MNYIDSLSNVLETKKEDSGWQLASNGLAAFAQVYSYRVDSIYNDMFKILGGISRTDTQEVNNNASDNPFVNNKQKLHKTIEEDKSKLEFWDLEHDYQIDPLFKHTTSLFSQVNARGLLNYCLEIDGNLNLILEGKEEKLNIKSLKMLNQINNSNEYKSNICNNNSKTNSNNKISNVNIEDSFDLQQNYLNDQFKLEGNYTEISNYNIIENNDILILIENLQSIVSFDDVNKDNNFNNIGLATTLDIYKEKIVNDDNIKTLDDNINNNYNIITPIKNKKNFNTNFLHNLNEDHKFLMNLDTYIKKTDIDTEEDNKYNISKYKGIVSDIKDYNIRLETEHNILNQDEDDNLSVDYDQDDLISDNNSKNTNELLFQKTIDSKSIVNSENNDYNSENKPNMSNLFEAVKTNYMNINLDNYNSYLHKIGDGNKFGELKPVNLNNNYKKINWESTKNIIGNNSLKEEKPIKKQKMQKLFNFSEENEKDDVFLSNDNRKKKIKNKALKTNIRKKVFYYRYFRKDSLISLFTNQFSILYIDNKMFIHNTTNNKLNNITNDLNSIQEDYPNNDNYDYNNFNHNDDNNNFKNNKIVSQFNQDIVDQEFEMEEDVANENNNITDKDLNYKEKISRLFKIVNVRKIKKKIWEKLSVNISKAISNNDSINNTNNIKNKTDFNSIVNYINNKTEYSKLKNNISSNDYVSASTCFVCLLHLCNENSKIILN